MTKIEEKKKLAAEGGCHSKRLDVIYMRKAGWILLPYCWSLLKRHLEAHQQPKQNAKEGFLEEGKKCVPRIRFQHSNQQDETVSFGHFAVHIYTCPTRELKSIKLYQLCFGKSAYTVYIQRSYTTYFICRCHRSWRAC